MSDNAFVISLLIVWGSATVLALSMADLSTTIAAALTTGMLAMVKGCTL